MAFGFSGDSSQSSFSSSEMPIGFSGDGSQSSFRYLGSPSDGDFRTSSRELGATLTLTSTANSLENYTCDYGDDFLQCPVPLEPQPPPAPWSTETECTGTTVYISPPAPEHIEPTGMGYDTYHLTARCATPASSPPRAPNSPWTTETRQTHAQHSASALPPPGVRRAKHQERHHCPLQPCKFEGFFRRKGDLVRHLRSQHPQPEDELHPCPFAGCFRRGENGFLRRDKMLQHQDKVHGGRMGAEFAV
jgi:hypothetical protein